MKKNIVAFASFLACTAITLTPVFCAESASLNPGVRPAPSMTSASEAYKPAISELAVLRSQVAMLREDLNKERAARENLQAEMQKKIDFLVGLMNLNAKKTSTLETSYKNHTHEYTAPPFGFITKLGFGNIPSDALIPYVTQDKVGHGGKVKTGTPVE